MKELVIIIHIILTITFACNLKNLCLMEKINKTCHPLVFSNNNSVEQVTSQNQLLIVLNSSFPLMDM